MAFVNAYLTEKEKEEFEKANIRDPRYSFLKNENLSLSYWTIDKQRKIALISCGIIDRDEPDKEKFALIYKHLDKDHFISFTLAYGHIENKYKTLLKQQYNVGLVKKWILKEISIPDNVLKKIQKNDIFTIIEEALCTYGVDGNPNSNDRVKAFLEI